MQPIKSKSEPKGASALTADQVCELLGKLRASKYCGNTILSWRLVRDELEVPK